MIQEEVRQHPITRTGYMMVFKKLKLNDTVSIEHKLGICPLVDVYQLDYFQVVASEDDYRYLTWVNYYLYHSAEKVLRFQQEENSSDYQRIQIETQPDAFSIPFDTMLTFLNLNTEPDQTLDDVCTQFWEKLSSKPHDEFDDDQYTSSPWFDRCRRDTKTVAALKKSKEWDNIRFQMRPRKTINLSQIIPTPAPIVESEMPNPKQQGKRPPRKPQPAPYVLQAPVELEIVQFDFNKIGLTLKKEVTYPKQVEEGRAEIGYVKPPLHQELKVMVLLRV